MSFLTPYIPDLLKSIILFLIFLIFSGSISAQQVRGTILNSATNEPVAFAQIKSDSEVTLADVQGEFSVEIAGFPAELLVSAPGFETKQVILQENTTSETILLIPEVEQLSEIVLKSSIIPKRVLETPASVNILTSEDLERGTQGNLISAVGRIPGVTAHRGALNTNKISIRGIGARSQYSTNRIKAYFMGIPITTAEGATTLDDIAPEAIGRAEIIKGPASSLYGAGLGGVINLYPAAAEGLGTKAAAEYSFGSFGFEKITLSAGHNSEARNLNATYDHLKTETFRENGDYDRKSFTLAGNFEQGEENSIGILAQFTKLKAFIPSSLNYETFRNDPGAAAFTWLQSRGFESYDKGLFGISYDYEISESFSGISSLYTTFRDAWEPRPFDILKEEQIAAGARTKFLLENKLFGAPSKMSFGAEFYTEWYDSATFANLYEDFPGQGSVAGEILSNNSQNRSYINLFAQLNLELSEKLNLETGFNVNSTNYYLEDLFYNDEIDQSGDYRFGTIFSPRVAALYELSEGRNLYATISHGFSTPTVAETLTPEGLINTDLQPETGFNYEVGFKGNFLNNRLYAEVAAYSIQLENLLVAERVAEDRYIGRNAGKTDHNGIEILLNYNFRISPILRAETFTTAAINSFRFDRFIDDGEDFSGNYLPAVPRNSLSAGFDLLLNDIFVLHATFQHEGKMPLNDENSRFTEDYQLLDLKAVYSPEIFPGWKTELFAGVNNILNAHYAASIVPNAVGFGGAAPRYYYPGEPRNYYAGIGLAYRF